MKLFENIKEFFFSADDDDLDQDDVPVRHERSYQPSDNDTTLETAMEEEIKL